jgi:hypothetical protein
MNPGIKVKHTHVPYDTSPRSPRRFPPGKGRRCSSSTAGRRTTEGGTVAAVARWRLQRTEIEREFSRSSSR